MLGLRPVLHRVGPIVRVALLSTVNKKIIFSSSCVKKLRELGEDHGLLRIVVDSGGCSGFQYKYEVDKNLSDDDIIIEHSGVKIVVDPQSMQFLEGSKLDYEEELIRSGFRIANNPQSEKESRTFKMEIANEASEPAKTEIAEHQTTNEMVEPFVVVTAPTKESAKGASPPISSRTSGLSLKPGEADALVNSSSEPLIVASSEAVEEPMDINSEGCCEGKLAVINVWFVDYAVDWAFSEPKLFTTIEKEFSHDYHGVHLHNNYLRGCKWSPDGCCLLTLSFDNAFRLFDFPPAMASYGEKVSIDMDPLNTEIPAVLRMPECELVYDYCWFPYMRSDDPSTCCFVSTGRRMPVRLWDAYDGSQRAVYLPTNHLGEFTSPQSVTFSTDGRLLYCGFRRYIQVFYVDRPGAPSERRPPLGQRSKQGGLFSALSAPVLNAPGGGSAENVYAVGTFSGTVAVYSELGGGEAVSPILQGPRRGVSQVQFVTPASGVVPWYLIAGGRSDGTIYVWDSRFMKSETPLATLSRRVENYQRFQFDVDLKGRYLFTGNQTGAVSCYDLQAMSLASVWRGHEDSCHSVSVHPFLPVLATASGQKRPLLTSHLANENPRRCVPSAASKAPESTSSSSSDSEDELPRSLTDAEATAVVASGDGVELPMAGRLDLLPIRNEVKFWIFPYDK
ncbi:unnamed protein product [Taenia asiatica]|uniref:WD repeat-containing protein 79 n=1 Tax=Taenia asiatica TaxID=60517 RepID=A0A158R9V6_TAEAS|nr:unnamed protein product [Taenia asiatica]